ncbi:tyrosine-type recombinase/integrase [Rhizobium herbae]|uniref:Integrase n=1 Tax=Rhizobium herbae TaxID=508661 RepID=A0ABS4EG04_9HYPH|nr:site-specific integrase [Rhizobium herbae]MBP1856870.1 integrase [Rhizobium herbae]
MARVANKLTARRVETIKEIGKHSDGGGLYLKVAPDGKRWVFMGTLNSKRIELGLGSALSVSLAGAREKAAEYRAIFASGKDPRKVREEQEAAAAADAAAQAARPTFGAFAFDYIEAKKAGWKNDKHLSQWYYTLSVRKDDKGAFINDGYCIHLRDLFIDEITTEDVLAVLKPIWTKLPETAARLRGRIEAVLDSAKALKKRSGENPAVWKNHLQQILPKRSKLSRGHHAAMAYGDVPAYMKVLTANPTVSNLALKFVILTAGRSGEIIGAKWSEVDEDARVWTVPKERMKNGKEHVVPLSDGAMEVLTEVKKVRRNSDFVFPGPRTMLSVMAMTMAMRRTGAGQYTPHGFRSAFRDWAGDTTSFMRDDIELCLAHTIKDETERAYRRGNAVEKRRKIMDAWWKFTSEKSDTVIQLADRLFV